MIVEQFQYINKTNNKHRNKTKKKRNKIKTNTHVIKKLKVMMMNKALQLREVIHQEIQMI